MKNSAILINKSNIKTFLTLNRYYEIKRRDGPFTGGSIITDNGLKFWLKQQFKPKTISYKHASFHFTRY